MAANRLTAVDAQMFWMSSRMPNDTFLLYGFEGVPTDLDAALAELAAAAGRSPDLTRRVSDDEPWHYPRWVPHQVDAAQFRVHHLADSSWAGCLAAVVALVDDQLDAAVTPWRLHVFPGCTVSRRSVAPPPSRSCRSLTCSAAGAGPAARPR